MSAQGNQGEPGILLVVVLALIVVLAWFVWHETSTFWLENVIRWVRFVEIWIINLFTHDYGACLDWLRYASSGPGDPSPQVVGLTNECFGPSVLNRVPSEDLPFFYRLSIKSTSVLGAAAMAYYRWPLVAALLWVAGYGVFFSPRNKFMTKHTLESLIVTQAKMWPIISPIVKFNPSKSGRLLGDTIPDKLPIFAEALSPEEWISWNRIPLTNGVPDRDAVRRAFIHQLGPRWAGVASLPLHMRALLAAFALKGVQKRDDSDALLGRLSLSWSPEKGFHPSAEIINEVEKILKDPAIGGRIDPIASKHAWRITAILGVLRWARDQGGVLAPAQFLWLRAEDRALWYPLNNLGRRAFHSEGAGALAHFMAETAAKKPLPLPRVDTAVVTLNTYLHDPDKRTVPIPPREESR
jgi:intracellular multiplication protein IcmP